MAVSDFNPDQALRKLPTLQIELANGTIIPIPAGRVKIVGGANVSITREESSNTIVFETSEGAGTENSYYREKFEALANTPEVGTVAGGGGSPEEPAWVFSAAARWVAALQGARGTDEDHNAFLLGSLCTTVGLFDQPVPGYPEGASHILSITDQCAPATNLLTIKRLLDYVTRLTEAYDYVLSILDNTDPSTPIVPPDGLEAINAPGFLQQLQVMRHYWNFLVSRSTVKFGAISSGQGISFSTYFRNTSDQTLGDLVNGVVVTVTMDVFRRNEVTDVLEPWNGLSTDFTELRPITRDSADNPPLNLIGYDVSFSVTPSQAVATFKTFDDPVAYQMPPESELYCDGVIIFKSMDEFDDGNEYVMRMTATIDTASHMGIITRDIDVYFTPPVEPEPEPAP